MADLQLGRRNQGCRIEGTVCCVPFRSTAIELLLSEDTAKAVILRAYNLLPVSASMAEVRRLLPVGTRLTVKEPYYKSFADGSSGIRVDNPADIVFLQDNDQYDKSLSFDVMKERGNAAFRSAKHLDFIGKTQTFMILDFPDVSDRRTCMHVTYATCMHAGQPNMSWQKYSTRSAVCRSPKMFRF